LSCNEYVYYITMVVRILLRNSQVGRGRFHGISTSAAGANRGETVKRVDATPRTRIIIINTRAKRKAKEMSIVNARTNGKVNTMNSFKAFNSTTINDLLRYRYTIDCLLQCSAIPSFLDDAPFTRKEYNSFIKYSSFNAFATVGLDCLRKHNFIYVHHTEVKKVYVVTSGWDTTVVPMTDEVYESLPPYFKDQIEVEERKTHYYMLNTSRCRDFVRLTKPVSEVFGTIE